MSKTAGILTSFATFHRARATVLAGALLLLVATSAAARDTVDVQLLEDQGQRIVLQYRIDDFDEALVDIDGTLYVELSLLDESPLKIAGAPELPTINRSVIIPDDARMAAHVVDFDYVEYHDVDVAPSKGILYRSVDPADVPYPFGPEYAEDQFFPGVMVDLQRPYILRDHRGVVVEMYPFQYNPVTRVLRVIDTMTVELVAEGPGETNVLHRSGHDRRSAAFSQLYAHHFLNAPEADGGRYDPIVETGGMLIIAHDDWLPNVQPLVAHKNGIGIPTTAVGVSTIGNNDAAIKSYIENEYNSGNLTFVLLVGDSDEIDSPSSSGGACDPCYAKISGNDDYPEIVIGRFSAENAGHVDTQVQRTISYENMPATTQGWYAKGVGIGSSEGPGDDGEMDYEHVDVIRDKLLAAGYTQVDQIYDPGASASAVSQALNDGRGIVNYCGHGWMEGWGTTGFSNSNVNSLTNDDMLPFIVSVACNNGEFNHGTCFGEAWLRATNGGSPTGAIGVYASTISQSWDPPMAAQDETVDLLLEEAYFSFGALAFAGSCLMMDEYGAVDMYDTWTVFGDPSVRVVGTATPPTGLQIEPFDALVSLGNAGGPFDPVQKVYTLENLSEYPIDVEVGCGESWVSLDPASGTIPAGGTLDVTVSINTNANSLPNGEYGDTVTFTNVTDHEGDTDRSVDLEVGAPEVQVEWPLDSDPGWTVEGEWAFGEPQGLGGEHGSSDPTSGHTGTNVYGYNLQGDYPNDLDEKHLTSNAIDCTNLTKTTLKFWRWLGVETPTYDHAYVRVSTDGSSWTTVWQNDDEVTDSGWTEQTIDISDVADGQPTVYLRWTMGTTDEGWVYCGWNIDDIELWGVGSSECADGDGDGYLPSWCGGEDCDDNDSSTNPEADEICDDGEDNDCDGDIDDVDPDCAGDDDDAADDDDDAADEDGGRLQAGSGECECRVYEGQGTPTSALAVLGAMIAGLLIRRRVR